MPPKDRTCPSCGKPCSRKSCWECYTSKKSRNLSRQANRRKRYLEKKKEALANGNK